MDSSRTGGSIHAPAIIRDGGGKQGRAEQLEEPKRAEGGRGRERDDETTTTTTARISCLCDLEGRISAHRTTISISNYSEDEALSKSMDSQLMLRISEGGAF